MSASLLLALALAGSSGAAGRCELAPEGRESYRSFSLAACPDGEGLCVGADAIVEGALLDRQRSAGCEGAECALQGARFSTRLGSSRSEIRSRRDARLLAVCG